MPQIINAATGERGNPQQSQIKCAANFSLHKLANEQLYVVFVEHLQVVFISSKRLASFSLLGYVEFSINCHVITGGHS